MPTLELHSWHDTKVAAEEEAKKQRNLGFEVNIQKYPFLKRRHWRVFIKK